MKTTITALLLALCLLLSGCSLTGEGADTLMRPPALTGEQGEMQKALTDKLGKNITLKYPKTGQYRTAYVSHDIDGDEEEEVLVFYQMPGDNTTVRIDVLKKVSGQWQSVGDVPGEGADVDRVMFGDLNGDGVDEIIVGWTVISSLEKTLVVYAFSQFGVRDTKLVKRAVQSYTEAELVSFTAPDSCDLLVINLNTSRKKCTASLIKMLDVSSQIVSTVEMDGNVTSYAAIKKGQTANGANAIFLDGYKGANTMITEIVYFNGTRLLNPLYDEKEEAAKITMRNSTMVSQDLDGDGQIEIPMPQDLPGYEGKPEEEKVRVIYWYAYMSDPKRDKESYSLKFSTIHNTGDGYYLKLPDNWRNRFSATVDTASRRMVFYDWTSGSSGFGPEIMRIQVFPAAEFAAAQSSGFVQIKTRNDLVYAVRFSGEETKSTIDMATLQANFAFIAQ